LSAPDQRRFNDAAHLVRLMKAADDLIALGDAEELKHNPAYPRRQRPRYQPPVQLPGPRQYTGRDERPEIEF